LQFEVSATFSKTVNQNEVGKININEVIGKISYSQSINKQSIHYKS